MESTDRLVRTWMGSGREQEIQETASGISSGQMTLLNVVKALGDYLTADEDELRNKGVQFLSLVLKICPAASINRQSTQVLVTFYCSKLEDTETIIPALNGLTTLASLSTCTSVEVELITRAVFFHVKMAALTAPHRFLVFSVIDSFMARYRDVLKAMRKEFLSGYIALADGEKDPRNLLTAFAIARVILVEFDISDHIEALFNVTFCYFPISFRPPAEDPYGISAEDLKMALRSCLCATPFFGPLAIPVYLEKLMAGSPVSKRDTLQSMAVSLPVYGASLARDSARKIWNSLKLEIFQPTDHVTEEEALKTTQVLIRTIYSDASERDKEPMKGLAQEACEESIHILQEPEKSQAKPAIKVICAFMSTTPSVSRYTTSRAVPHLVKLFLDPDELPNRAPVTVLLAELVVAARDSASETRSDSETEQLLTPFKDEVLGVFTVGLKTASSCQPALAGLKAMVNTPALLTDEELGFIVHNVGYLLQTDPDDKEDASADMLDLLSTISNINPRHVEEQMLPLLFSSLPDIAPSRAADKDRAKYSRVLLALNELCIQPQLFETLVIRLLTKLDLVSIPKGSPIIAHGLDLEPAVAYAHAILATLANTLRVKVNLKHADIPKYIDRLVFRLYNLFIYSALLGVDGKTVAVDSRVVRKAAVIITLVVGTLSVQRQDTFSTALFSAYFSGDVKGIAEGHQTISRDGGFLPFKPGSSVSQRNLVALFAAGISPLRKEVRVPVGGVDQLLRTVIVWNTSTGSRLQKEAGWHILASVINKSLEGDELSFLSFILNEFWHQEITEQSISLERRRHGIRTCFWISKALLARNSSDVMRFVDRFFELLGDENIGWDAGRVIGEIAGTDEVLTKENHASIKILYAQKYFNSVLPRIMQGAKSCPRLHEQSANLVALTCLIKSVPQTTYMHEMPSLMPLLLRGLDLPDTEIRANVIDTFVSAVGGEPAEQKIISEHASTLVHAMLKNSSATEMHSTRVRISALRYLAILPNIVRYDVLHPQKPTVIRDLEKVLDDPKRSVRKEAVDARTNWFKYNG